MTEAIAYLADLTPIGAILVLASIAAVALTQLAKQQSWSKQRTQTVATVIAALLGLLAAIVLGLIAGIPDSVIQIVSSILLSIAAVAVLAKVLYGVLGYVIPDGRPELPSASGDVHVVVNATEDPEAIARALSAQQRVQHRGRRADRDGVPDGRDTPPDAAA